MWTVVEDYSWSHKRQGGTTVHLQPEAQCGAIPPTTRLPVRDPLQTPGPPLRPVVPPPRLPGSIAHARDVFYMKHCGVMERLVTDTPIFQTGKLRIRGKVSHSRSDSRPGQDFKLDTIDSRPHAVFTPPACSV